MDEIAWRILNLVAKRGYIGATREDFFREIRGVVYEELEKGILALEKEGYVVVEWLSDSKFLVTISDKGSAEVKEEYERRLKVYQERVTEQKSKAGLDRV
jgi:DNA-binding PadR family transcriptional regulator